MKIAIINGPNINLVGTRETDIYGTETMEHYFYKLQKKYEQVSFDYYQSNVEGELINEIHKAGKNMNGIILNAGAYTHTSIAIGDAVASISIPVIEVHISNVFAREEFRKLSHITAKCSGTIFGFGLKGYMLAIEALISK